jgi:fructokinase
VTFVDVARDGERRFLFYRHPSADMTIEASSLDARAFRARWLHFGSSTLARSPSREATLRALALAEKNGAKLSLDLNLRRHLWPSRASIRRALMPLVDRVDVLKASEEDVDALGISPTLDGVRALHLRRRRDRITLFTLGPRGAVGFWGERVFAVQAARVRVVDVSGAGDAFVAGALAVLCRHPLHRLDDAARDVVLIRALRVGCALGTRTVTRLGATAALASLDRFARLVDAPLAPRARAPHPSNSERRR